MYYPMTLGYFTSYTDGLVLLPMLLLSGLSLWALIDCAVRPFTNNGQKVLWIIAILVAPLLGSILYFLLGRKMASTG